LDAPGHALGDLPAPGVRGGVVGPEALEADAELAGALEELEHLGVPEQRLGRDAAPVQADAPGPVRLDDGHTAAELCGPDRGDVAARPGPDDDGVEPLAGHRPVRPGARAGPRASP